MNQKSQSVLEFGTEGVVREKKWWKIREENMSEVGIQTRRKVRGGSSEMRTEVEQRYNDNKIRLTSWSFTVAQRRADAWFVAPCSPQPTAVANSQVTAAVEGEND